MSIRSWWSSLTGRNDESALERAADMADETPDDRVVLSGDIDAVKADQHTGLLGHGTMHDYERLGE